MKKYRVGVLGATGMVGQRFLSLLNNHPYFEVTVLAASSNSRNKTYYEAAHKRFSSEFMVPKKYYDMNVYDVLLDIDYIAENVDLVFCAVSLNKEETIKLEEMYAKKEVVVVSNNSANRMTFDVPMIIPELNSHHLEIIDSQRKRLNTKKGFIVVKSNCSLQSYIPLIYPLKDFKINSVIVSTYQAISGAGKTFETWPEMVDNIIPFINNEEEKSENEPKKIFGYIKDDKIVNADINISARCIRVPITDGHLASVFIKFDTSVTKEDVINKWQEFNSQINLELPSSCKRFITYFEEDDRPQTKIDRNIENGMGISVGRLDKDSVFDFKFVALSHNTIRGAAGGAILLAELLCQKGYI